MISQNPPKVSIITATYNWSNALRCSITSALMQTFSDFELLVVGDGCTDDSEEVTLGFQDTCIRWMNLPLNSGSQSKPNNYGIWNSTGEYIAYLGHDDIWFPTHLESLIDTIERTDADLAGAVTMLYGPPGSGVTGMSGVFASGEHSQRDFLPPSSILHRRALVERIGMWEEPLTLCLPADVDFQRRAYEAGAKIVSSGQLTVFKFNAAWRRNSYLTKSTAEQEEMLSRIRSGTDFRQSTLIEVVRSFLADKYARVEVPEPREPGYFSRLNARYKGTSKERIEPRRIEEPTRFYLDDQLGGFEWHGLERNEQWISLMWSGPSRMSTLEFPVLWDQNLALRVHIPCHFQHDISKDVQLFVNGEPLESAVETTDEGTTMIVATLSPHSPPAGSGCMEQPLRISFLVARTGRPFDRGINEDRRSLGIAVNWVEFSPLSGNNIGN